MLQKRIKKRKYTKKKDQRFLCLRFDGVDCLCSDMLSGEFDSVESISLTHSCDWIRSRLSRQRLLQRLVLNRKEEWRKRTTKIENGTVVKSAFLYGWNEQGKHDEIENGNYTCEKRKFS